MIASKVTPQSLISNSTLDVDELLLSSPESLTNSLNESVSSTDIGFDKFTENIGDNTIQIQSDNLFTDVNEALVEDSSITMLPNYNIQPTGDEFGDYLVIDLGGSTLRVAVVSIDPRLSKGDSCESVDSLDEERADRVHIIAENSWIIPNDFKTIDLNFFKFIGDKINTIISLQSVINRKNLIKTGITWSFPLDTTTYNRGKILCVSKGFTISDEIYNKDLKDIIELVLLEHFDLQIDVRVILNDSLAVYAAGAFVDKYMKLALVLGTGVNMCCSLNSSDKIHENKTLPDQPRLLYNAEVSLFGHKLLKTFASKYDEVLDSRLTSFDYSYRPFMEMDPVSNLVFQPFELMTSGRYIPELARIVVVDLVESNGIFVNLAKNQEYLLPLATPYEGFSGELLCFIDETEDLKQIITKLHEIYGWPVELLAFDDIILLKNIVRNIIKRAAIICRLSLLDLSS
jgi:hexokinase